MMLLFGWSAPGEAQNGTANLQTLDVATSSSVLNLAQQAGAVGVRATPNISWRGVEPFVGGPYVFTNQDAQQQAVQARGLENFRIISSTRPEYNSAPSQYADRSYLLPRIATDSGLDLWERYKSAVRAVVKRYYRTAADGNPEAMPGLAKGVHAWSYTPEVGTFWVPINDPVQRANDYATMFKLTSDAIHEVDSSALVFLPFNGSTYLGAFSDGYLPRETIDYDGQRGLTRQQVASQYANGITFAKSLLAAVRPDAYDLHLYGDADSIPGQKAWLLATLASLGLPEKPVWSMEGGEPYAQVGETFPQGPASCVGTGTPESPARLAFQSSAMLRHFALAFASNIRSVTFNLSSEYSSSGTSFGDLDLLDACGRQRPAYTTFKVAREKLVPYGTATELTGLSGGVRIVRFTFTPPKADMYVAWDPSVSGSTTNSHDLRASLSFPSATVTHAVTLAGQTSPVLTAEPTSNLVFGATPVFIESVAGRLAVPGLDAVVGFPMKR